MHVVPKAEHTEVQVCDTIVGYTQWMALHVDGDCGALPSIETDGCVDVVARVDNDAESVRSDDALTHEDAVSELEARVDALDPVDAVVDNDAAGETDDVEL